MPGTPTSGGPVEQAILGKLSAAFEPDELQVLNESYMHSVPPGSESHFKVVVVSQAFSGQRALGRHRMVHTALQEELDGGVHALSVEALTPEQWAERSGAVRPSPACRGGSKAD